MANNVKLKLTTEEAEFLYHLGFTSSKTSGNQPNSAMSALNKISKATKPYVSEKRRKELENTAFSFINYASGADSRNTGQA